MRVTTSPPETPACASAGEGDDALRLAMLPIVPWIPSVLRRVWRDVGMLQIGTDGERAIVLGGITPQRYRLVNAIDGRRTSAELVAGAGRLDLRESDVVALLRQLQASGVLVDLASDTAPVSAGQVPNWHPDHDRQLLPDLSARILGTPHASPQRIARSRRHSQVLIHGARRVGSVLAAALASAGVGRINIVQSEPVDAADVVAGGFGHADVGDDSSGALTRAVARVSAQTSTTRLSPLESPDLVILTETWPGPDEREQALRRIRTPYLCATVRERRAVIGPFVIPGESSCLECQHLSRRDRDPQWPAIYGQLRMQPHRPEDGGEAAVALLSASLACIQALQWLDGERLPETINTTLEIGLPDLLFERRFWPRHRHCPCQST